MQRGDNPWLLHRFVEELDLLIEREGLGDDLQLIVLPWIMSLLDDPYSGVRREGALEHPEFGNLWFGAIPQTDVRPGRLVACSYWVSERTRLLRCNSYALLGRPH